MLMGEILDRAAIAPRASASNKRQVLAVIDSPDLGQAYDDYDKAADSFQLTKKNLARQEELPEEKLGGGAGPTVPSP